jgi:chaperone required for assembly of F1-ATPase
MIYLLAVAIAAEWDSQTNKRVGIQPSTMPLMSIASTAIDHFAFNCELAKETCISFLPTDTILIWNQDDKLLYDKQLTLFQPIIHGIESKFKVKFETTSSIVNKLNHPSQTIEILKDYVESLVYYLYTVYYII